MKSKLWFWFIKQELKFNRGFWRFVFPSASKIPERLSLISGWILHEIKKKRDGDSIENDQKYNKKCVESKIDENFGFEEMCKYVKKWNNSKIDIFDIIRESEGKFLFHYDKDIV
jgi:hypothetical protein